MVIFSKSLDNLAKLQSGLKGLNHTLQKQTNKPLTHLEKSMQNLNKLSSKLEKSFKTLGGIAKNLGFTTMGILGGAGLKGLQAMGQDAEAKRLGVTAQERDALTYAGKQSGRGGDYFKDILGSLRESLLDPQDAGSFANLGIDLFKARDMKPIELLNQFLESAKSSKLPIEVLNESLQKIAGINFYDLQALNLDKFKADLKEGENLSSGNADKLKSIGEGFNRIITSLDTLLSKTLEPFAPAITKIFDSLGQGLAKIAKSQEFQSMLSKIANFATGLSQAFGDKMIEVIKDLPNIFRDMQIIFLNVIGTLANMLTWITTGSADRKLSELSESSFAKAGALENDKQKEELARWEKIYADLKTAKSEAGGDASKMKIPESLRIELNLKSTDGLIEAQNAMKTINLRGR